MSKITKNTMAKGSKKSTTKNNRRLKMTKPDFMNKFEMTPNMVIGGRDAKIWVYKSTQASKAKPAVKEVKAIKAIKEVKAESSKIVNEKTLPAVKAVAGVAAVKAVKAQPAVEAISQKWMGYAIGNTHEIVSELIARLGDQGFYPDAEYIVYPNDEKKFSAHYTTENVKGFRAALKLCKSSGKYNDPGLKLLADKEAAKNEKEKAAAKKAREKEAVKEKKEKTASKDSKNSKNKKEGADWPTE